MRRRIVPIRFNELYEEAHAFTFSNAFGVSLDECPLLYEVIQTIRETTHKYDNFLHSYMNFLVGMALNMNQYPVAQVPALAEYYRHCDKAFRSTLFGYIFLKTKFVDRLMLISKYFSSAHPAAKMEYVVPGTNVIQIRSYREAVTDTVYDILHHLSTEDELDPLSAPLSHIMDIRATANRNHGIVVPFYVVFN
jgi:hypothetical protein